MNHPETMRRRLIAALGAGALFAPLRSLAAEPPLIGYLLLQALQPTPTPERQAFLDGLRAQRLVEGRDYRMLYKSAELEADFLEDAARELVKAGALVIVATGGAAVAAAGKVSQSIPIVGRRCCNASAVICARRPMVKGAWDTSTAPARALTASILKAF